MRIHNLYTDAAGESHFRDIEIDWVEERRGSRLSKRLPASGVIFRETKADNDLDFHNAPRRQYIVNLDAGVRLTASDGESRVIGPGEYDWQGSSVAGVGTTAAQHLYTDRLNQDKPSF